MAETFFQRLVKKEEKKLPIIPVKDMVLFAHVITPIFFERENSKIAVNTAMKSNHQVIILTQRDKNILDPEPKDLYEVGTLANIAQVRQLPEGFLVVVADGISTVRVKRINPGDHFLKGTFEELKETYNPSRQNDALFRSVIDQFKQVIQLGKTVALEGLVSLFDLSDPIRTTNVITFALDITTKDKQKLLEMTDIASRLELLSTYLAKEIAVLQTSQRIQHRTSEEIGKMQREVYLREQLRSIEKELGISEENGGLAEVKKKIEDARMPDYAFKTALAEYDRLKKMPAFSPEVSWIRTYLDWLTDLPWSNKSSDEAILNEDHYGLEKVKQMVLEYLAVIKLVGKIRGPILLFVGPPGTGKTSIGQSIARAMNRKFTRMSLGGIRDEAEIKGFRRTYVGAQPGRIIQGIKSAGTKNPVFMLDEIDKVGVDFRGDPSAALLEALDPAQNNNFQDHYIEIPFDLSDTMFITTANILDTIPPPLRDRMEMIPFSGYTVKEKLEIAKRYLIPKLENTHGFKKNDIAFPDSVIKKIINAYTKEAGVRNLEREIASIFRKVARKIAENSKKPPFELNEKNLEKHLGAPRFHTDIKERKDETGVTPALAWSETGGVVLFVEAQPVEGKGHLILTGKLGDVMKESAEAALTYARAHAKEYGYEPSFYEKADIHIHVPEGAIPKDGPSAGIAIATAIISALSKRAVKKEVGMTGEITLRGRVLPIGGVKEKVLAGETMGLKTIILPKENMRDIDEVPEEVKQKLNFIFVDEMREVLKEALR